MLLTVAIPTYNRNQTLLRTVRALLPQLTEQCNLLILDNCSDVPVAETLQGIAEVAAGQLRIVRNKVNIGLTANLLRCFEMCETEWVWLLGDDDFLQPDAIETIFHYLALHPESLLFNFPVDHVRKQLTLTTGLAELVGNLDGLSDIAFISSSVYKVAAILPNLKFGYQFAYTMHPHLAALLVTVGDNGACCLVNRQIADRGPTPVQLEQQWSLVNLALGFPTLLDLPLKPAIREDLAQKLLAAPNGEDAIGIHALAYQLLLMAIKHGDRRSAVYYFDQICGRWYYFDRSAKRRIQLLGYRLMLRYPGLVRHVFRLVKGREISDQNFQNRYERA